MCSLQLMPLINDIDKKVMHKVFCILYRFLSHYRTGTIEPGLLHVSYTEGLVHKIAMNIFKGNI